MQVVAISLVRNEDRFIRQALLNVADSCDRILVADHMSTDRTPEILRELTGELDQLEVRRVRHSAESHSMIEAFAGTDTWILSVDGDELYEPAGLRRFRENLEAGAFSDVFRIRPAGLHCDHLDGLRAVASGFLSPPSRPLVGALNFAAIESWSGVRSERLHGGDILFRRGYDLDSWRHLGIEEGWDESPFRSLHVCFLRRSSSDPDDVPAAGRANLAETRAFRRDLLGPLQLAARRAVRRGDGDSSGNAEWKGDKYRRGDRVTVDVSPFFA